MAKRLYVGNIPWSATEDQLRDLFSQAGNVVSATIITDKQTGRSRGFAFVEMSTDEEADNAVQTLDKKEVDGRTIFVSEAREREERAPGGNRGRSRDY